MSANPVKFRPKSPVLKEEQSPLKKARVSPPGSSVTASASSSGDARKSLHTHSQLWKWTLTTDAVAPCRVQDIFALEECEGAKGSEWMPAATHHP